MTAVAPPPADAPPEPEAGFLDCRGRYWKLRITVPDLRHLRAAGFNPQAFAESFEKIGSVVFADPEKLVAWTHILAHPPADLDPEEFAAGFDGPTLENAGYALIAAVLDFFPNCPTSRALKKRLGLVREAVTEAITRSFGLNAAATS
jgi:hypothetical protein